MYLVALDLEFSGPWCGGSIKHDEILSAAFVVFDLDMVKNLTSEQVKVLYQNCKTRVALKNKHPDSTQLSDPNNMVSDPLVSYIMKPQYIVQINRHLPSDDLKTYWEERGWNLECLNDFKNPEALRYLQECVASSDLVHDIHVCTDNDSFANLVNKALTDIEQSFPDFVYVSDTFERDNAFLTVLLQSHGFHPLSFTRSGDFRWQKDDINSNSYTQGVLGIISQDPTEREAIANMRFMLPVARRDHNSINDAIKIARDVLAANIYSMAVV